MMKECEDDFKEKVSLSTEMKVDFSHTKETIVIDEINQIVQTTNKPIRPLEAVVIGDEDEPEEAEDADEVDQTTFNLVNRNQKLMLSR